MASRQEKLDWLRLARTPEVGPATFAQLIARFGSASRALEELPGMARRGGGKNFIPANPEDTARELDQLENAGGKLIRSCDDDFPEALAALSPPPPLISVLGKLPGKDMIAIVGARNASALARKFAHILAKELGEAGLVVVSGLARGIDSAAHEAALEHGTVAVVAGGVDVIYPPENESLYRAIVEQGAVISEMPFGEAPQARHFPRRNRLISGLARGVVVVEAAERSGSLITANYALEQGREIFAVPGSPLDPRAEGTNSLIRDGAHMATRATDIIDVLKDLRTRGLREPIARHWTGDAVALPANDESTPQGLQLKIMEILSPVPVSMDELIRAVEAPAGEVLTVILELELAGRIERQAGNRVNLI